MVEEKYTSTLTTLPLNSWPRTWSWSWCCPAIIPSPRCPHSPRWLSYLLLSPQRPSAFPHLHFQLMTSFCFTEKIETFRRNFLGFIIYLIASTTTCSPFPATCSKANPSASSLDYCYSKCGPCQQQWITWKLLSHTESRAPSFHQTTLIQSPMTPLLPNPMVNSQSSSFSTY